MHTKPKISSCFIDASDTADVINKTCFGAQPNSIAVQLRDIQVYHAFVCSSSCKSLLNFPLLSDRNNRLVF